MQHNTETTRGYKRIIAMLVIAFCASVFVGCNTMKGAGEDIEDAGEAIQDGAD